MNAMAVSNSGIGAMCAGQLLPNLCYTSELAYVLVNEPFAHVSQAMKQMDTTTHTRTTCDAWTKPAVARR